MTMIPRYEDQQFHYQNIFGLETFAGYEFSAGGSVSLFTEIRLDFHFERDSFLAIKTVLGMSFMIFRREQ